MRSISLYSGISERKEITMTSKLLRERYRTLLADSLKALQCLIYQCSEGNIPETDAYQALKAAESAIAIAIAEAHPAYAAAGW